MNDDEKFMRYALKLAEQAAAEEEVPVGAVVVRNDVVIGRGHNQVEALASPTAHAEMIAIRQAAAEQDGWRLTGCTLYVTKEPCPMCAGAIVMARIDRLVFGAYDDKLGYAVTLNKTVQDERLNHQVEVTGGVLADEAVALLRAFFAERR